LADATTLAEQVRTAVGGGVHLIERFEIKLTVSIGMAEALTDDDEARRQGRGPQPQLPPRQPRAGDAG
jgi:GGDEF domain-containing protein